MLEIHERIDMVNAKNVLVIGYRDGFVLSAAACL